MFAFSLKYSICSLSPGSGEKRKGCQRWTWREGQGRIQLWQSAQGCPEVAGVCGLWASYKFNRTWRVKALGSHFLQLKVFRPDLEPLESFFEIFSSLDCIVYLYPSLSYYVTQNQTIFSSTFSNSLTATDSPGLPTCNSGLILTPPFLNFPNS